MKLDDLIEQYESFLSFHAGDSLDSLHEGIIEHLRKSVADKESSEALVTIFGMLVKELKASRELAKLKTQRSQTEFKLDLMQDFIQELPDLFDKYVSDNIE